MLDKFDITLKSFNSYDSSHGGYCLLIFLKNNQWGTCHYFHSGIFSYKNAIEEIVGIEIEDVLNFSNLENIRDSHLIPQEIRNCWNWIKETNYIQKQLIFK